MTALTLDAVSAARMMARDRAPDGRRLSRFRHAPGPDGLWLMTRARGSGTLVQASTSIGDVRGRSHAWHLAHAIRQDLWRAVFRVRGLCPVVHIRDDGLATAAALAPHPPPDLAGTLAALFTEDRIRLWRRFAARSLR